MRGVGRGGGGGAVVLVVLVSGVGASWSAADDPVYGMVEAIDPLVGSDWGTPLDDPEVMQAGAAAGRAVGSAAARRRRAGHRRDVRVRGSAGRARIAGSVRGPDPDHGPP